MFVVSSLLGTVPYENMIEVEAAIVRALGFLHPVAGRVCEGTGANLHARSSDVHSTSKYSCMHTRIPVKCSITE